MVRPSELLPAKRSSVHDAIMNATSEEIDSLMNGLIKSVESAEDWTSRDPHAYRMMKQTEAQFISFYAKVRLSQSPPWPEDPWAARTSYVLRDRLGAYLLFRLKHSKGHDASGYVRQETLNTWASQLLIISSFHIRGAGSTGQERYIEAIKGCLPDASDCLGDLIRAWCLSTGDKLDLPRRLKKLGFYGRYEVGLLLETADALIAQSVSRGTHLVQLKSIVQMLFTTCCRPGG